MENLTHGDQKSIINFVQFEATIWAQHNTQRQSKMENNDFVSKDANVDIQKKTTENFIKSNKCNQSDYSSSHAGHLRTHLKTHSAEKPNKCSQCDFASSYASTLKIHLKHTVEKSQTNATSVTLHPLRQAI